jgi:predicted enzyme related to lactoylglutathione lyase
MTQLDLLVIRARDPEALARFYALLGLEFKEEQHGTGPKHLACDLGGPVLEIYPLRSEQQRTTATRLGFRVSALPRVLDAISALGTARVLRDAEATEWGQRAVVIDPEGHTLDLVEVATA